MTRRLRVRAIKRRELDEDKLALAFLMLAKLMREQEEQGTVEAADQDASQEAA